MLSDQSQSQSTTITIPEESPQSNTTTTTIHGIPTQPMTPLNPLTLTPSMIHHPLNALKDVDGLFLEETARTDEISNYSIINEAGQRLFHARVTYCYVVFTGSKGGSTTHKIHGIEILEATGFIVANTSIITEAGFGGCGPKCSLHDFTIDIYGKTLAKLVLADRVSCECPNEFHLDTMNGSFSCKLVSEHGSSLCCCAGCPKPFQIYDNVQHEVLGQMHRSLTIKSS